MDLSVKEIEYTDATGKKATVVYAVSNRQEQFAQIMAFGECSAGYAYAQAFEKDWANEDSRKGCIEAASRLMNDTTIVLRIQELKKPVLRKLRRKFEYGLQKAFEQAGIAWDLAYAQGDVKGLLKAIELQSRLGKLLTEEVNVTHRHGLLDDAATQVLLDMRKEIEVRREKQKKLVASVEGELIADSSDPHRPPSVTPSRVP